jgi:hyperosmotically inducible protein
MKSMLVALIAVSALILCGCSSQNTNEAANDASQKLSEAANTVANKTSEVAQNVNRSAGPAVNDATITARIKAKHLADNITGIDVDTTGCMVMLTGAVATDQQKARAEEHARETDGVKGVKNELVIKSR